jgi:hypothetical protein
MLLYVRLSTSIKGINNDSFTRICFEDISERRIEREWRERRTDKGREGDSE